MENLPETRDPEIKFSQFAIENLLTSASWMKFIAIIGFISVGLLVIMGFGMLISGSPIRSPNPSALGGLGLFLYLLFAVATVFPSYYLFQAAGNLKQFAGSNDPLVLEKAFDLQKKYWRLIGIYMIIGFSISILSILGVAAFI